MTTELATTELKQILSNVDYKQYSGGLSKEKYNRMNSIHAFLLTKMKEAGKTSLEITTFFEGLRGY